MNLTLKARKGLAAGLALSTLMWSVSLFALPAVFAAPHSEGCIVLSGGTVWMITGGQRRGFTSAEVFASHGYNFGQVVAANAEDEALPVGPIMTYADGSLVKGPSDPLVYLVANGQKRGFVSGSVFTGLGFSFANIQWAPINTFSDLPTGANLESATERHTAGVLVREANGTVWKMTATGRMGIPSMEVFNSYGFDWNKVVTANAADLTAANEGVLSARAGCTGPQTPPGTVNVSLAGPASSTLIVDTTDGGNNESQAIAPLSSFTFTGNGTVTSLTLSRTGVSTDTMLSNVYLFDGSTRITDAGSFSSNNLTFSNASGLFTVSGSKTITVRADLDDGTYAGQTVGINLTGAQLSSGSVGGVPVNGNMHTVAGASLATVSIGAVSDSGASDPGNDIKVWEAQFTVGVRDVNFSRLALRQINNIQASDIKNFRLFVDGVQIAQQQSLDSNGYVTFSGFNKTLKTGSPTVKVVADVTGGSTRTVEMSLRNKADVELMDSQYNVHISAVDTYPADSDGVLINSGTVTVAKATDSPSGNVTNNASNVLLGKWVITAYGEPIKVENLAVAVDITGENDADVELRNGKLHVNGSQVGSTTTLVAAGAATAAATFTTNFVINPGTPVTVELYSDIYDLDTTSDGLDNGDDIQVYLIDNDASNATRQVSLSTLDVPTGADYAANSLNVSQGTMTLAALASYPNQTTAAPQTNFKLGAWTLTGSTTEDINLSTFSLDIDNVSVVADDFTEADLANLYIKYGSQTTNIKPTPSAADNEWSVSYTLVKNTVLTIELWGDIKNGSDITDGEKVKTDLSVTGTTVQSGVSASQSDVDGQTITEQGSTFATAKDASSPVSKLVDDSGTQVLGVWKLSATYDTETVTEVDVNVASASAIQSLILREVGGGQLGPILPGATSSLFTGLNLVIPANSYKLIQVEAVMSPIGVGAGSSGSTITATLDSVLHTPSSTGVQTLDDNNRAANAMYAFKSVPTITNTTLPTSVLTTGTVSLAKFTISSGGTGTVAWKSILFTINKTGAAAGDPAITNATLWDADTNTEIAGTDTITTLGESNASGTVLFSATSEQEVSGAKTYVLKATVSGTLATGDNINTYIAASSADIVDGATLGTDNDAAALATSGADFVWSDQSALSHSTATFDWYSDFLVKNLPTDSQTLTK